VSSDNDTAAPTRPRRLSRLVRRASWVLLSLAVLTALGVLVVLTFSVSVRGRSMQPTLHNGYRLVYNIFAPHAVRRFDVVEVNLGPTAAVKRVIGLPGDTVEIVPNGATSSVLITPAGSRRAMRVESPTWGAADTGALRACCNQDGTLTAKPTPVVIPADHYWVIGDNWSASTDSRVDGFVARSDINARLDLRLWPLSRMGSVRGRPRLVPAG